jgi:hypothetical protein
MKKITLILISVLSLSAVFAKNDHSAWGELLKKNVSSDGKVNYKKFKTDVAKLDAYLKALESDAPQNAWTANEKKAYWINAYNAYTVKLILNHYPTKTITNIKVGGKDAWKHAWIKIGTETLSLSDIEDKKLRDVYKDGRIHFVINCASKSCPILLNKAVTAANVESLLTETTKNFINGSQNKITAKSIEVSEIFNWYAADFKVGGTVIDFINKYSKTKIDASASITYKKYDWNLNE